MGTHQELVKTLRPRTFEDVIGQVNIKEIITANIRANRFPKLSLLTGDSGVGKSTIAEICALSLTCENRQEANPCGKCPTCIGNLQALASGHNTDSIVKVNIGSLINKKDILEVIKEIFVLQPRMNGSVVYVLEEIHALSQENQIPLLEEFMSIPDGTHIILCTTQQYKVIPELTGRATKLALSLPNTEECITLIERSCLASGIDMPKPETMKWLCRNTGNSPREIVKIIDVLSVAGTIDMETVKNYLGAVTNEKYIEFMEVVFQSGDDVAPVAFWFDEVKESGISLSNFVRGLKDFMIDLALALYGENKQGLTLKERKAIKVVFEEISQKRFLDLMSFVQTMSYKNDKEAMYSIFMFKREAMGMNTRTMNRDSKPKAMATTIDAERIANRNNLKKSDDDNKRSGSAEISMEGIQNILKTNKSFVRPKGKDLASKELELPERSEGALDLRSGAMPSQVTSNTITDEGKELNKEPAHDEVNDVIELELETTNMFGGE